MSAPSSRENWILSSFRKDVAAGQDAATLIEFWIYWLELATNRVHTYPNRVQAHKVFTRMKRVMDVSR